MYSAKVKQVDHSPINDIPFGSHACIFYHSQNDLISAAVPYFQQGLNNNECCIWVGADPSDNDEVYQALKKIYPKLEQLIHQGQMQFVERKVLMPSLDIDSMQQIIDNLFTYKNYALAKGFNGLRIVGAPVDVLQSEEWDDFLTLENGLDHAIDSHPISALCCFSLKHCNPTAIIDIIKTHDYALIKIKGEWEIIEHSAHKILNEKLSALNIELEERIQEGTANLDAALQTRDEFLSIASHEIKTPLTTIRLYVDGMIRIGHADLSNPEETRTIFKKIQTQCSHLESLINNLLDASSVLQSECFPIKKQPADFVKLIREAMDRLDESLRFADCSITFIEPESIMGHWDINRIDQIITNLLTNAIKHAPGPITITAKTENDMVIVSVEDSGKGIAPEYHQQIFDRYTRLCEKNWGLGLGLWVTKKAVEAHNGKIYLRSEQGKGSCFTLKIPLQ